MTDDANTKVKQLDTAIENVRVLAGDLLPNNESGAKVQGLADDMQAHARRALGLPSPLDAQNG